MKNTMLPFRIPPWLASISFYSDKVWYVDTYGHLICGTDIIRLKLLSDSNQYNHNTIAKIHNENLLLGITDEEYNDSLADT